MRWLQWLAHAKGNHSLEKLCSHKERDLYRTPKTRPLIYTILLCFSVWMFTWEAHSYPNAGPHTQLQNQLLNPTRVENNSDAHLSLISTVLLLLSLMVALLPQEDSGIESANQNHTTESQPTTRPKEMMISLPLCQHLQEKVKKWMHSAPGSRAKSLPSPFFKT